ncbi:MAG: endonuclease/exonuclease/phosphatase family protein, partial [Muribaculaceae bacterium]|nr:endonuclease/exonuclease/phosphatase family protein [Muribaculaceae bacterium]
GSAREGAKFTLLTYNIMQWEDFEQRNLDYNATMDAVLKADADIVALQECNSLEGDIYSLNKNNIKPAQLDSLYQRYPYRVVSSRDLALLSKYPILSTSNISADSYTYAAAKYEVELPCGDRVTIFNVHLQSIGLSSDDKAEYQSVVSKQIIEENVDSIKGTLKYLKHYVYPKLAAANISRAAQARIINALIKKESGRVILCGDFNDIPYSFAYLKIKGRMHDLYTERGFGPTVTYHANRLYFRIDQVFYKGRLLPLDIGRKSYPCSDHYPLLAEFEAYN